MFNIQQVSACVNSDFFYESKPLGFDEYLLPRDK